MRIAAICAAALALACAPASSAPASRGTATLERACGPTDGPAVLLTVRPTAGESPRFRLRISGSLDDVAGRTIDVRGPGGDDAYAEWCGADTCDGLPASARTAAAFGPMQADSSVSVRLRSAAMDGAAFEWNGVAAWRGGSPLCG